ncbi:MAG: 2-succinyl-5-enolpyruvyl-6-hydroxy-3-cyclohexene-1-carboxylic-acid synthase, partial [Myxococcota bacterium]
MGGSGAQQSFEADPEAVARFMRHFFAALAQSGVAEVCISPGSRSTPLVVGAFRTPGLRTRPIIDERSAAFFALGLARQSQAPVALICTSGTAAANYLPAVVEAHHARVPLLVLTADRPPELRDWGAGQTVDQVGIYGAAVRRFVDVPPPVAGPAALRYASTLASRAVADALAGPAGPVHLNFPLREPLEPPPLTGKAERPRDGSRATAVRISAPLRAPDAAHLQALVARVRECERGIIACGPRMPDPAAEAAIAQLSERTGWPILADPTSQLRRGPHAEN